MNLLIVGICLALQKAPAEAPKPEVLTVNITVKQVLVSDKVEPIHRRLKTLAAQLKKAKIKFGSLKLLSTQPLAVPLKKEGQVTLANDMVLKLSPQALAGNQLTLKTTIYKKKKVKTARGKIKVVLTDPSSFTWRLAKRQSVIVGGYDLKGDKLIVLITADWKTPPPPPPPTPGPKK